MSALSDFKKTKEFLVCVDSDGCAMDTMNIKHNCCFGPCMVDEWKLQNFSSLILPRWNDINLYTITRGINRFKGLLTALTEINDQYTEIEDLDSLKMWVDTSCELSNSALERAIAEKPDSVCLKKALNWSNAVNVAIRLLPEEKIKPFDGVKKALEYAHIQADIAVVSSANHDAVLNEWEKHGLLPNTDVVLTQNAGRKAYCISELLKKGYSPEKVLMCGDALGDMQAAEENGVLYFPILVRLEKECWEEFVNYGFEKLVSNEYAGEYAEKRKYAFLKNLGENDG